MKYELNLGEKPIQILIWRIWPGFGWWCHSRFGWSLCYSTAFYKAVNYAIKQSTKVV